MQKFANMFVKIAQFDVPYDWLIAQRQIVLLVG